ncbi:PREDICTED: protein SpAN-like [Priapulus caudatus]|uniref:Metalloendopeptidase n=1 Tax=Priapulus caudatus TaxID=37621 RepID=A0ABM1DZ72_PRICU|nr:PREDICTED: protein SpAN-like [Priapulus caudatus]
MTRRKVTCWSFVGNITSNAQPRQDISIGMNCEYKMTAIHEMMHCTGFQHTQCRTDRDVYITVYLENVQEDMRYNFDKYTADEIDLYGAYDLFSVMHYSCYAFSMNGRMTMSAKTDPTCRTELGQPHVGGGFVQSDIDKLNCMYCGASNDHCPQ